MTKQNQVRMNQENEIVSAKGDAVSTEDVEGVAEHDVHEPLSDDKEEGEEEKVATEEHLNNQAMESIETIPRSNEHLGENGNENDKKEMDSSNDDATDKTDKKAIADDEDVEISKTEDIFYHAEVGPKNDAEGASVDEKSSQEEACSNEGAPVDDVVKVSPQEDCTETIANEKDISKSEKKHEDDKISKREEATDDDQIATQIENERSTADGDAKISPKEDDGNADSIEASEKVAKVPQEQISQSEDATDETKIRPAHDNDEDETDSKQVAKGKGEGEKESQKEISEREGASDSTKIKPDSDDDDDGDSKEESDEDEKQPTDEYGRPLSAYEIMRLERIKRNKAKLAQLGLEQNGGKRSGTLLGEHEENMRKRKALKKKEKKEKEVIVMRRSMSRRTKGKNINYSEPTVAEFKLPPSERKKDKSNDKPEEKEMDEKTKAAMLDKKARKEKRENRVPLFIYQELKQVEKTRRHAVRTAEKLVRASEKEMRIIKRQVDAIGRREKQRKEKKELKAFGPVINEIDRGRVQLIKTLRKIDNNSKERRMTVEEWKCARERNIASAQEKFPTLMKEAEQTLGQALLDRLPPFEEIEQNGNPKIKGSGGTDAPKKKGKIKNAPSTSKKKAKASNGKKGEITTSSKNSNSVGESSDTTGANHSAPQVSIPGNLDFEKLRESADRSKRRDSSKITKTRNVGGPVTNSLGATVQRKWLESDGPVAPTLNEYAPQAGDTVL